MQNDESSRELGFDIDATLKLTQRDAKNITHSLELTDAGWNDALQPITPSKNQGMFAIVKHNETVYVQENYELYPRPESQLSVVAEKPKSKLNASTRNRIEALAKLLHQPKEQVFRILPCIGWKYLAQHHTIVLVFEVQQQPTLAPVSLLELLHNRDNQPELGAKYRLALGLARCIAQLHMVGWFHESFRSENVLLFPQADLSAEGNTVAVEFAEAWVFGFEFSRQDTARTVAEPDFNPDRDIYRHPERQGELELAFTRLHDIYALGVVLLEIGLWDPALKLQKKEFANATAENASAVRRQLVKHAKVRLESKVGRKYRDLVIKCLTGDFGVTDDNKEDLKLQQAFRSQVVDVLERSAIAV